MRRQWLQILLLLSLLFLTVFIIIVGVVDVFNVVVDVDVKCYY